MKQKKDLFEELKLDSVQDVFCSPLDIDPQVIKQKVGAKIDSADSERKSYTMKSKKKISLIAIAATLTLGITVFAANGIVANWFSSSSSKPDYQTLPTVQQVTKDIGYAPVLIDRFENGYVFKDGNIIKNNLADEAGKSIEQFKSVSFDYEKDGDRVIFSQDQYHSEKKIAGEAIKNVQNVDIYYDHYTNKCVPADYVLTEEDKKAEENGELVFSYGSPEVKISEVQSVSWIKNDMMFDLLQIDGKLSAEELSKMAEEVLNFSLK